MTGKEKRVRELAQKRWARDRRISQGSGERDIAGLAVRAEWDDTDSLCQVYLREAKADIEQDRVTDFNPASTDQSSVSEPERDLRELVAACRWLADEIVDSPEEGWVSVELPKWREFKQAVDRLAPAPSDTPQEQERASAERQKCDHDWEPFHHTNAHWCRKCGGITLDSDPASPPSVKPRRMWLDFDEDGWLIEWQKDNPFRSERVEVQEIVSGEVTDDA